VIKIKKANHYKNLLLSHRNNLKSLWKIINEIVGRCKITCTPNCIEVNNARITDSQEIANAFNSFFTGMAKNLHAQNQPSNLNSTKPFKKFLVKNSFFFNPITCHEIKHIVYTIKPKSSIGSDGIPSKL